MSSISERYPSHQVSCAIGLLEHESSAAFYTMTSYTYTPLDTEKSEIRLIQLVPGKAEDPIAFSITHASLIRPDEPPKDSRLPLEELQKTLPDGWFAKETLDGRYFFMCIGHTNTPNSWNHPDPLFDRSLYEVPKLVSRESYKPEYEALSYTWGSSNSPVIAIVQTEGDHSISTQTHKMFIGQNLACALRSLRFPERTRTLWVDAVCINQQDINERNTQVPRMGDIYSLAKSVVIWLGPESDNSTHALSTLEYFGRQVERMTDGMIGDSPGAQEPEWFRMRCALPYDDSTWLAISSLFHRAWFTRIWVLQEAMLSSNAIVQCGEHSIDWLSLRKTILVFFEKTTLPGDIVDFLVLYSHGLIHLARNTFQDLLMWTVNQKCTDPRDKIYGILSMISPKLRREITVDYNMSVVDVYKDAVLADIRVSKRVNILRDCELKTYMKDWPSWVPTWTPGSSDFPTHTGFRRHVSGYSRSQVEYHAPDELHVLGVFGDAVATATRLKGTIHDICKIIRQVEPDGLFVKDYVDEGTLLDAFLEVITKGRVQDRFSFFTRFPTLHDLRCKYKDVESGNASLPTVLENYKRDLEEQEFWVFTTQDGYLGATSSEVKPGNFSSSSSHNVSNSVFR